MSEPTVAPAETPSPSAPQPFGAPVEPRVGGCGKPVLIGCGVIFLLIGVAGVGVVLKARDLLAWSLERAKPAVVANLANDVQPADRERFESAFAGALVKIRAGQIDPLALQGVQAQLMKAVGQPGGGKIPRATLVALTEAFEKLGGTPPATTPEPVPEPGPAATKPEDQPQAA